MAGIKVVFVEKKPGFDIEAGHILSDLKENLKISGLKRLRMINRYFVEGLGEKEFETCLSTVFSEPPVDYVYVDGFPAHEEDFIFAVKYLPGQYDQRADSAAQCIQIVTGAENPVVECAKIYICSGLLSSEEQSRIQAYCINPVDSMEAPLEIPRSLSILAPEPDGMEILQGFIHKSDEEILSLKEKMGLAMSGDDLIFCRNYFKSENRDPVITEIKVIDTYWSDHCRHTTFLTAIENVEIQEGPYAPLFHEAFQLYQNTRKEVYGDREKEKDMCLMDVAVLAMKSLKKQGLLPDLDESEEINACSIVVPALVNGQNQEWLVMFKNETHNHPTEIEPFGGAATCLGGAIRDPLSGRAYVYQAMRVTGSGDPRTPVENTLPGKLPQRKITLGAAAGYSSYGNQIGLATGHVSEIYHEGYVAKRMEIGAVVGAAKRENVRRERPAPGDVVLLVGGRTGRDGCGGATGSSKEHTEDSIANCGAEVQKGNPPTERKLQRLFRNPEAAALIKRCNDFGAGGVSVAIGELADGLDINLDLVPKKYEGLNGTELAISESQERMAVVVSSADGDRFIEYARQENLEATLVAHVTGENRLRMNWRGHTIVDLSRDFLNTNGAKQYTRVYIKSPQEFPQKQEKPGLTEALKDLNAASQKGLTERFDATIGRRTILMPYGGKYSLTPSQAMAAKLPVLQGDTDTATIMAYGFDPDLSVSSPFHGAVCAVVESVARIAAAGGEWRRVRLTFQEYFERLGDDPARWGKPAAALLGAFYVQMKLGLAAIGGKDSMSGSFKDMDVPPTLVSFGLAPSSAENIISPEFKACGNKIGLLTTKTDPWGLPDLKSFQKVCAALHKAIQNKTVVSAHTLHSGTSLETAMAKMAFGNGLGFQAEYNGQTLGDAGIGYGSFVVEIATETGDLFHGVDFNIIGEVTENQELVVNGQRYRHKEALEAFLSPLERIFPTGQVTKENLKEIVDIKPFRSQAPVYAGSKFAAPTVVIPVFPGTNCEDDTKALFETAGAKTDILVIRNLTVESLEESLKQLAETIRKSQIIAIPGGFSAGDEPEGSGKFIAAVFRSPQVREAAMELLQNRQGLIIGICNGFQALMKLGLLPYGEIRDMEETSPTLTFNSLGRHISTINRTKIISTLSPWLAGVREGDIHNVVFSHGEGRFAASPAEIARLAEKGQIATQYVDFEGKASMDLRHNPNGSHMAIEGITSPCGRVLGKMGHSERIGRHLYKNIPGCYDQRIFESGVKYFS